jgi:hypothetical protein
MNSVHLIGRLATDVDVKEGERRVEGVELHPGSGSKG